jgi:hypothetical protein
VESFSVTVVAGAPATESDTYSAPPSASARFPVIEHPVERDEGVGDVGRSAEAPRRRRRPDRAVVLEHAVVDDLRCR